jgi:hypothetical protein
MWNVKMKETPVITGATGTISKSFRKYLGNIPRKHGGEKKPYWAMHTYFKKY